MHWSYSKKHYREDTIRELAESYMRNLRWLVGHCVEQGQHGVVYTPADYGLTNEISYDELDRFLDQPANGKQLDNIMEF